MGTDWDCQGSRGHRPSACVILAAIHHCRSARVHIAKSCERSRSQTDTSEVVVENLVDADLSRRECVGQIRLNVRIPSSQAWLGRRYREHLVQGRRDNHVTGLAFDRNGYPYVHWREISCGTWSHERNGRFEELLHVTGQGLGRRRGFENGLRGR